MVEALEQRYSEATYCEATIISEYEELLKREGLKAMWEAERDPSKNEMVF